MMLIEVRAIRGMRVLSPVAGNVMQHQSPGSSRMTSGHTQAIDWWWIIDVYELLLF